MATSRRLRYGANSAARVRNAGPAELPAEELARGGGLSRTRMRLANSSWPVRSWPVPVRIAEISSRVSNVSECDPVKAPKTSNVR